MAVLSKIQIQRARRRRLLLSSSLLELPEAVPNTHVITNGDGGDGQSYGFATGNYGSITPATQDGANIDGLRVFGTKVILEFAGGASPIGEAGEYDVDIAGAPGNSYKLSWSAGFDNDYRLETGDNQLRDHLAGNVGNEVEVSVVEGTLGYVMTVGRNTVWLGYWAGTSGAMDSDQFEGETIIRMVAQSSQGVIRFDGNVQVGGYSSLTWRIDGQDFTFPWNAGSGAFVSNDSGAMTTLTNILTPLETFNVDVGLRGVT